jgi:phage protein D
MTRPADYHQRAYGMLVAALQLLTRAAAQLDQVTPADAAVLRQLAQQLTAIASRHNLP